MTPSPLVFRVGKKQLPKRLQIRQNFDREPIIGKPSAKIMQTEDALFVYHDPPYIEVLTRKPFQAIYF
ncbi:MAG: hypothetical protein APF78_09135 [Sphingomonadales bacterium BRH_c3]|nr:MAG: hypothetical protein APF78_09135 [Sphingomonadales bacterium BRH_c3]